MNILYFIYLILYITITVLIFTVSAAMLHPRTCGIFRKPAPHIHYTTGKILIAWGMTYVIFIPDFYLTMTGSAWRDMEYIVVTMLTTIISVAASCYALLAYLQQPIRMHVLLSATVLLPLTLTVWYVTNPAVWLLNAFTYTYIAIIIVFIIYYARLYKAFVLDIKGNYSNVDKRMFNCIWTQWGAGLATFFIFLMTVALDNVLWNIINILSNTFCISLFIYTSEHIMPLPDGQAEGSMTAVQGRETESMDIAKALQTSCKDTLLFCNSELSLSDLALAIGTNRTYLSRWFTANDTTFYNYINHLRVNHAEHLLRTTNHPVTQVQAEAGFINSTTFRKYFQNVFGCLPSEYRKKSSVATAS